MYIYNTYVHIMYIYILYIYCCYRQIPAGTLLVPMVGPVRLASILICANVHLVGSAMNVNVNITFRISFETAYFCLAYSI